MNRRHFVIYDSLLVIAAIMTLISALLLPAPRILFIPGTAAVSQPSQMQTPSDASSREAGAWSSQQANGHLPPVAANL